MADTVPKFELDRRIARKDYRAWSQYQPSRRLERIYPVVIEMVCEHARRNLREARTWGILDRAVRKARLPCQGFTDGMTVEVDNNDYEPDAVLRGGDTKFCRNSVTGPNARYVLKLLLPNTSATDRVWKLRDYFRLPSLRHHLIVWRDTQRVAHHRLATGGDMATAVITASDMVLESPRIRIKIAEPDPD